MKKENKFELLEVTGNSYVRGKKYGEVKKESIDKLIKYLYEIYSDNKKSKESIMEHVRKHIPYIKEYSKEIFKELQGIADGSDKLLDEIIMIHLHEEKSGFSSHNCTTYAATGRATVNQETFIGQTWDIPENLCDNTGAFLLKERTNDSLDILSYTYAGMLSGAGMNSKGISLVWNSVPRINLQIGVPTYIIIAEILRQKKIGDALAAIFRAKRAGCFNFLISDETEIYSIEASPNDVGIFYSDSYFAHTNHFLSDSFKEKQDIEKVAKEYSASTVIRQNRINRMLREKEGNIDIKGCKDLMYDHVNHPESICRHPDSNKDKEKRIITCSSFVMSPSQKELWITNGPACENKFQKYSI
ncbi:MAG: C45 family peptidase [Halanaerobiales bacterium]|nr:C45 family peptidase [Halanaerobiales bacterium]